MTFEFEVLKKRIAELKAKNAELEAKKTELLKQIIEENTKRNVRVEKLEQKNKELETRLVIYYEKPLVNVKTNNSFPEEVCYNKQELITEVTVSVNSVKYLNSKSLEKKDMNSFLLEAHKKIISSEIKQYNKKKFLRESAKNQVYSKLSSDKKTVTNGNDQDLKLLLSIGDNVH
ncbi:hypothetical protein RirG_044890 [Rhizophagus irregularis DAOM 197198w]|uniref:Uncharacterized protein n=1 Tax=Rhizophagus irregularis (strain DAOM 197198w) TaxID=1432141 RepID=A0A015N7B9_RHIIW|nr:hypothetical protein RirG_044890 [Rhizophagus irregularis DAOM 197198w]